MNLLDRLAAQANDPQVVRAVVAKVTAVSGSTVSIDYAGTTLTGIPKAAAYAAATNDVALVIKLGSAWLALAKIA